MKKKKASSLPPFIQNFKFPPIQQLADWEKVRFDPIRMFNNFFLTVISLTYVIDTLLAVIVIIGGVYVRLEPTFHEIPLNPAYYTFVIVWLASWLFSALVFIAINDDHIQPMRTVI